MSRVFEWCALLCDGRQSVGDDVHIGVPRTAVTADNSKMHETAAKLSLSVISAEKIIHEHLKFSRMSTRWIPAQLIG